MSPSTCSESATGPGGSRARSTLLAVVFLVAAACGPPRERFHGMHGSAEGLAEDFLRSLAAEDRPRLEDLALSKQEFLLEVFPEMPAYGNVPPDFVWSQLEIRSHHGLSTVLASQGGRHWDLEEMVFTGGETAYQTFTVHREPMLRLRDRRTGETREMALFGSLLEHGGRYKLVSFNIDR